MNELKQNLELHRKSLIFKQGEVWFCSIGINVGREQDGKHELFERPVIILRKFNNEMFWGIPVTSQLKFDPFHFNHSHYDGKSSAILSQLRLIDVGRLQRKIFELSNEDFLQLRNMLRKLI